MDSIATAYVLFLSRVLRFHLLAWSCYSYCGSVYNLRVSPPHFCPNVQTFSSPCRFFESFRSTLGICVFGLGPSTEIRGDARAKLLLPMFDHCRVCRLTRRWSDLRYLMSKPSKSLESKSSQHVAIPQFEQLAQSSRNFLWWERKSLLPYLQLTICPTSFLVMIPATKMGDLSKSSERSEILLPNPGIFEHVCISGWSNPLGTWKLVACIIPKRIEFNVYVRPPSNYIQYR